MVLTAASTGLGLWPGTLRARWQVTDLWRTHGRPPRANRRRRTRLSRTRRRPAPSLSRVYPDMADVSEGLLPPCGTVRVNRRGIRSAMATSPHPRADQTGSMSATSVSGVVIEYGPQASTYGRLGSIRRLY